MLGLCGRRGLTLLGLIAAAGPGRGGSRPGSAPPRSEPRGQHSAVAPGRPNPGSPRCCTPCTALEAFNVKATRGRLRGETRPGLRSRGRAGTGRLCATPPGTLCPARRPPAPPSPYSFKSLPSTPAIGPGLLPGHGLPPLRQ